MEYVHNHEAAVEDSTLFYEVAKLYRTFVTYVLSAPPSATATVATHDTLSPMGVVSCIYARIIGKCSLLVRLVCHNTMTVSQQAGTVLSENVRMSLEDAAQLMQTNAEAINYLSVLVQRESNTSSSGVAMCGYYHCTMIYWNVCSDFLQLLKHFSVTQSLTRTNTHNDISLLYTDESKNGNQSSNTSSPQSTHMWQSLQFRLYNAMLSTAPTIEQLHYELYRIEHYQHSTISPEDVYCVQQLSILAQNDTVGINTTPLVPVEQCTFRLRFILTGITKLFATIDAIRPTRTQLPTPISLPAQFNENKWLVALTELLLSTLSKALSGNTGTLSLLIYAPYLAEQILLRTSDKHVDRSASVNWIYWDLAKVCSFCLHNATSFFYSYFAYFFLQSLGEFTYLLRRQLRSLQSQVNVSHRGSSSAMGRLSGINSTTSRTASGRALHTTALLQASAHTGHITHGNGSDLTGRTSERSERTARLNSINNLNKNLGASASGPQLTSPNGHGPNINSSMFDPNKSLKSNSTAHSRSLPPITNNSINNNNNTSTTISTPNAEAMPAFSVNDKVDGHCTLPNGSKRWYPGIITSVEYDQNKKQFMYTVKYNDGEERGHQTGNYLFNVYFV